MKILQSLQDSKMQIISSHLSYKSSAGILSNYLTFAQSTTVMGILAIVESFVLFAFCIAVRRLKKRTHECEEATSIISPVVDMEVHDN